MTMETDSFIPKAFLRRPDFSTFTANERRILSLLREKGPASRADLARLADLSAQSAIRIVDSLMSRNVVVAGDKVISGPGQPSVPISLSPQGAYAFGVSLRQDAIGIRLIDLAGASRGTLTLRDGTGDRRAVIARIGAGMTQVADAAGIDRGRVFGVGVAMSGFFLEGGQKLNTPLSMGEWALRDVESELASALGLPVWIENDGNAAAIGENLFGAGQSFSDFAYIYVDRGLGGGLVLDGRLYRGRNGNAGEFTGLIAPEMRADRPTLTLLMDMLSPGREPAEEILATLTLDTPGAAAWLARVQAPLDHILSSIAAVCDPEAILIGGRLPRVFAEALAQRATFFQVPIRDVERPFPKVLAAQVQGDPASLGAAALPFAYHFF